MEIAVLRETVLLFLEIRKTRQSWKKDSILRGNSLQCWGSCEVVRWLGRDEPVARSTARTYKHLDRLRVQRPVLPPYLKCRWEARMGQCELKNPGRAGAFHA